MNDRPVVLSISMLVSGKEEMEKSLESLLGFKEAIPCEIILVDTGCSAQQRALALRYADRVVDFAWCGDFAAARNAGLREARGEWFLYLDDDEWFENPQEIIAFFRTGEYQKYNCASYIVRNYSDMAGTMYDDSYPTRMVRLESETRFVGKIHEYLQPYKEPKKALADFVHHYGYAYRDEEERKRHARRNIEPLREMCGRYPGDPRWVCQLAQEFFVLKEFDKLMEACTEGLQEWREQKNHIEYAPAHVGAVYAFLLLATECKAEFETEKEWLAKAFAEPVLKLEFLEPTTAFFCLMGARLCASLKEYGQCRAYFERYCDYYRRFRDDRLAIERGTAAITEGVFQEHFRYGVTLMSMEALIRMEDDALAEEAFYGLDWADDRLLGQNRYEEAMLDAFCSVPYRPAWLRMLQTLVSREDGMKEMLVVLLETEIAYRRRGDGGKLSRLYRLVAGLDYEHRYILCTKILWIYRSPEDVPRQERRERLVGLFEGLFERYPTEIFGIRTEVWDVADRFGIPMEPLFLRMDLRRLDAALDEWIRSGAAGLREWDDRIAGWRRQEDVRYSLFAVKRLEGYLLHYQEICSNRTQLEQLLWEYADGVLALRDAYGEEVGALRPAQLGAVRLAGELKRLQRYQEQGDMRGALACVRACLGIDSPLEHVINAYAVMCRNEAEERDRQARAAREELCVLVRSLKEMARQRMEAGEREAARQILLEVLQCVPEDEEAGELLGRLE